MGYCSCSFIIPVQGLVACLLIVADQCLMVASFANLVPIPSYPPWSQAKEDFDKEAERAKKKVTSQKQDKQPKDLKIHERRLDKEMPRTWWSYDVKRRDSGNILVVLLFMCSSMV